MTTGKAPGPDAIPAEGAVVALIFCFFNGEVRSHLGELYKRLQYKLRGGWGQTRQSMTLTSTLQSRPHRASLASIDTPASVIMAPLGLPASKDPAEGGEDSGGDGGRGCVAEGSSQGGLCPVQDSFVECDPGSEANSWGGGGMGGAVDGRLQISISSLHNRIVDGDHQSDADFTRSSSDLQPASVDDNESTPRRGVCRNGIRSEEAESSRVGKLAADEKSETSRTDLVMGLKKKPFSFFSKLWGQRHLFGGKNATTQDRQISNVDTQNDSGLASAFADLRNPTIVISQHEHPTSNQVLGTDGIFPTCSQPE
ncbi:hypothetical protein ACOMHN_017308 [Nucella lapillus]